MMLSVVIVSYNVKYFLEQCLCSVERARVSDMEVFVIDNCSSDGSIDYLGHKFPFAQFIANSTNEGFAKANNRVLRQATGKYILFLNPDTIVPEDFFRQSLHFFELHTDAGAMGVRMVDGRGEFLKESKRGFPKPWVAFCKLSGLSAMFPTSRFFAQYYLGHLPERQTHEADALAGACMFVRKEVLDKVGRFDEQFFMYAEDIDLSYRIQQAGYKNYYFPDITIIHFKGESTRKDRRYVDLFYNAMIQFVHKHFHQKSKFSIALLKMAIRVRARIASVRSSIDQPAVENRYRFSPGGDEHSIRELPLMNIDVHDVSFNQPLLFCEGPNFSFRQIIEEVQKFPDGRKMFIHGYGTNSLVGSNEKDEQGETFAW